MKIFRTKNTACHMEKCHTEWPQQWNWSFGPQVILYEKYSMKQKSVTQVYTMCQVSRPTQNENFGRKKHSMSCKSVTQLNPREKYSMSLKSVTKDHTVCLVPKSTKSHKREVFLLHVSLSLKNSGLFTQQTPFYFRTTFLVLLLFQMR